ncbi:MAG: murein transglycosylase domain-containing protein [bacterium]
MKKVVGQMFIFLLFVVFVNAVFLGEVNARKSLEEFRRQRESGLERYQQERQEDIEEIRQAYEEFYKKRRQAFRDFVDSMERRWGEGNARVPDRKNYVAYSEKRNRRHAVDFEEGKVEVEVILDPQDTENAVEQLHAQIVELVTDRGRDIVEEELDEESEEPSTAEPVLAGQLKNNAGEIVDESNAEQFAEEIIEANNISRQKVETEETGEQEVVSLDFSLIPNHLVERVARFQERVIKHARAWDLNPSLVFAIIHTESYFNPQARSHIPAYGLMQIVPQTAGKDAYNHIYGEQKLLGPNDLYDPDQNIKFGTAYIDLLLNRYLTPIENRENRLYCAIASYNTGAGNMSRAFVDNTSISQAADVINRLSPQQIYNKLYRDLPYEETRNYMEKITENQELYRQWDS